MAYKPAHYYHSAVPPTYRCSAPDNVSKEMLLERIEVLERQVEALMQGGGDNSALEQRLIKLESEAVKRSDLVEETHQSFDPNEDIIYTLRFKKEV